MKGIRFIVMLLLVIGAINWGLVGFFGFDAVAKIFGGMMKTGARVVYGLVGLAGLYGLTMLGSCCKSCKCNGNCSCCKKNPPEQ